MSLTLSVVNAADVVNTALAVLDKEERTRVLLAAAVLYGIIRPGDPEPVAPVTRPIDDTAPTKSRKSVKSGRSTKVGGE